MFNLFKRNKGNEHKVNREDFNLYAPVDGKCIDITEVNDDAFSQKMLGDGFAIEPSDGTITSPCHGEIIMLFPSGHAFGVRMFDGTEVMVHIGIDSVDANGNGFTKLRSIGDVVGAGEPVIKIDIQKLKGMEIDITTMVVISTIPDGLKKEHLDEIVTKDEVIVRGVKEAIDAASS